MLKKMIGSFAVLVVFLFFAACDNDANSSNVENIDKTLTKGDLSGCLVNAGTEVSSVPVKVILIEKSENKITFSYQDKFYCAGNDFYYRATLDEADETQMLLYLKAVNIKDGSIPGCDCPMRIGMEFTLEDQDLAKIEKVKIEYDFYWDEEKEDEVFSFEKINCFFKGKVYEEGDSLTDWCNLCSCTEYGEVACDAEYCGSCTEGETRTLKCENNKEIEWCKCLDSEKGWDCLEYSDSLCEE